MSAAAPSSPTSPPLRLAAAAIVPAAGASRRMGRPKLLLPYGGGTVLGALVAALRAAGAAPIVVVAAVDDAGLRAWCAAAGELTAAINPAPERGMLSSILAGLAALGGAGEVERRGAPLLVCPGDLPALRPGTVSELLRRRQAAGAGLAVPVYRGRRGHPLALAPALISEIASLDPARGLRQLLDLHPDDLLSVEVDDPGCVADLDSTDDYERLRAGSREPPAP
jgi:molybdenum cofactor cytidylyltransferase